MDIGDIKRWHWIFIGAVLGALLGFSFTLDGDGVNQIQSSDAADFERDLIHVDATSQWPLIGTITIHPAEYSPVTGGQANLVIYQRLARDKKGDLWWKDKFFVAKNPYLPAVNGNVPNDPKMTITTYLAQMSKQFQMIRFHDAWWLTTTNGIMLGMSVGIVVIGLAWPTILNALIGAGYGPSTEKGSVFKLSKYKSTGPEKGRAKKVRDAVADERQLKTVTQSYENNLQPVAGSSHSSGPQAAGAADVVKPLNQNEAAKEAPAGEIDEVELRNKEYYPILIHHPKPGESEKESKE